MIPEDGSAERMTAAVLEACTPRRGDAWHGLGCSVRVLEVYANGCTMWRKADGCSGTYATIGGHAWRAQLLEKVSGLRLVCRKKPKMRSTTT